VNQLLDKTLKLILWDTNVWIVKKEKIFRQGFCYDCFYSSAAVGDWIMKPELSTHLGIQDRDLEYEEKKLQPHIVYLALSSEVKVGDSKKTQVPTMDWSRAIEAVSIVEVPNRYLAGITEVAKEYYADKTNWRKMLTNSIEPVPISRKIKTRKVSSVRVQEYFF
jgi:hypothetical protein